MRFYEKKKEDDGPLSISGSMKEDIERERELEEIGPFSHWLEDEPDEDRGIFGHWLED